MIDTGRNYAERQVDAQQLVEDFANFRNIDQYNDSEKRLRFLKAVSPEMFLDMARHINARMRHMDPSLRENADEEGGACRYWVRHRQMRKKNLFLLELK